MNFTRIAPLRWLVLWLLRTMVARRAPDQVILDGTGDQYLLRWYVTRRRPDRPWWYLHQMVAPDRVKDPHCHPFDFTTWVLSGGYREQQCNRSLPRYCPREQTLRAGDMAHREATHTHVIKHVEPETWTLVRRSPTYREWGFYDWETGRFLPWREYVGQHPERAA